MKKLKESFVKQPQNIINRNTVEIKIAISMSVSNSNFDSIENLFLAEIAECSAINITKKEDQLQ